MFVARERELVERRSFRTSNYARTDKKDRFKIKNTSKIGLDSINTARNGNKLYNSTGRLEAVVHCCSVTENLVVRAHA